MVDIQAKYIRGGLASPVRPRITPMLPNRPTYQSSDPMSDMPPLSTITAGNRALNVNGYRPFVDLKVSKGVSERFTISSSKYRAHNDIECITFRLNSLPFMATYPSVRRCN